MKELSIEQKAKAYDEAIEKLRDFYRDYDTVSCLIDVKEELANLFPELKESEDEKIRKALIDGFTVMKESKNCGKTFSNHNIPVVDILAWLEKQGEHKKFRDSIQVGDEVTRNSDGVIVNLSQLKRVAKKGEQKLPIEKLPEEMKTIGESLGFTTQEECDEYNQMVSNLIMSDDNKDKTKFKVGDWIVNNLSKDVFLIKSFNNGYCTLEDIKGNIISPCLPPCESESHLWTIQDAKDGDVLINWNNTAFIFKTIEDETVKFHIAYNEKWEAIKTPSTTLSHMGLPEPQFEFHPATKEQRDTLFAKMKEAGYEWDTEKKELKLLITNGGDFESENCEQNPGWSKEDKDDLNNIIWLCDNCIRKCEHTWIPSQATRIKSLIERIKNIIFLQPKQQWSEEDEKIFNKIIRKLDESDNVSHYDYADFEMWLIDLKEKLINI